jgi:hypothetical protein
MKIRDRWLLEDVHSFDEPEDWSVAPELSSLVCGEGSPEDRGFRALMDDPEACLAGSQS